MYVSKQPIIGLDKGLSPCSAPSHYLNQCWNIVNWTLGNKIQWNLIQNLYIFIQENAFENVWKTVAILSQLHYIKSETAQYPNKVCAQPMRDGVIL